MPDDKKWTREKRKGNRPGGGWIGSDFARAGVRGPEDAPDRVGWSRGLSYYDANGSEWCGDGGSH